MGETDMVERVARALDPEWFDDADAMGRLYGPKVLADMQNRAKGLARAAIEAMRNGRGEFVILNAEDEIVASTEGPWDDAVREMRHYAAQYAGEGPLTISEIISFPAEVR